AAIVVDPVEPPQRFRLDCRKWLAVYTPLDDNRLRCPQLGDYQSGSEKGDSELVHGQGLQMVESMPNRRVGISRSGSMICKWRVFRSSGRNTVLVTDNLLLVALFGICGGVKKPGGGVISLLFVMPEKHDQALMRSKGGVPANHIRHENLDRDGERGFDYLSFTLVSSKAPRKGVGLRVADSHASNHTEGGFTPFKTIPRLLVVIGRRSCSGFEGETFEPKRRCCNLILAESDSLPHANAQTTNTYYKHQDSRINKAQVYSKTKTYANYDIEDLPLIYQVYQGRLLASFQDDAKYEHVGQDIRSQDGKDDKDKQGKDLKISESKMKSKDNDKG
ncbi:hypothetical protein Tco_0663803, partial [Tanacetum coccineum]